MAKKHIAKRRIAKPGAGKAIARKSPGASAATRAREPAAKAGIKKPARAGGTNVSFGLHGITRIMKEIHAAGLQSEFDDAVGPDHQFVTVKRQSLAKIRNFVTTHPKLTAFAQEMQSCNCPPGDRYCIYIRPNA